MNNKKVLVTGGSEGLGKSIAKKLHALGMFVTIVARTQEKLAAVAKEIGCDYIAADISCLENCKMLADKMGDIDILVNNAGVWSDDKSELNNLETIQKTMDVNLTGAIYLTECFLPKFKAANKGTIFFTNSSAGWKFGNDPVARSYSASKWGLRGYAEALEVFVKATNIKVISLYPGGMDTDLFEKSGWEKSAAHNQTWQANVEKIADAAVFAINQPDDINIGVIQVRKN
ncbi:MAG: SDR family oxidoreductase [Rickettsiales bacterium]|jgi:NADP-dependent 3-hydroxy acid dehydrogenase YdfG|nr:SDR family oxidoreductase [Rickettsiales bacterium]